MLAMLCAGALSCSLGSVAPTVPPVNSPVSIPAQPTNTVPPLITIPPVSNPSLPPSIGKLSISPTTPDLTQPDHFTLQPGSTVTLRLDGLQNVASVVFELPPPGWNGNGFSLSDPQSVQSGVAQYTTVIPFDHIGSTFAFSAQANGFNGQQLRSNMIAGTIAGTPDYAPSYDFTVSPATLSSTTPAYYMVKVGTTVTLRVYNIQHMATLQFLTPPVGWGKGSIMSQQITVTGDSVEYQYQVPPDVAGKQSAFGVYPLSPSGKPRPYTIDVVAEN